MWRDRLQTAVRLPDVAALDRTFVDMVATLRPQIVTDVGSRDGDMARRCKQAAPAAQVYAFEAHPENFFEFAPANCRAGVVFVPMAVSARRETMAVHVPVWASARHTTSLQFRGVGSARRRHDTEHHLVYHTPAVPLGEFFALPQHAQATFAHWIDVEGCTHEVLAGLGPTLAARTLFLKIEVETRAFWRGQRLVGDCLELCADLGFSPCAWFEHPEQFDVICANDRLGAGGDGDP